MHSIYSNSFSTIQPMLLYCAVLQSSWCSSLRWCSDSCNSTLTKAKTKQTNINKTITAKQSCDFHSNLQMFFVFAQKNLNAFFLALKDALLHTCMPFVKKCLVGVRDQPALHIFSGRHQSERVNNEKDLRTELIQTIRMSRIMSYEKKNYKPTSIQTLSVHTSFAFYVLSLHLITAITLH